MKKLINAFILIAFLISTNHSTANAILNYGKDNQDRASTIDKSIALIVFGPLAGTPIALKDYYDGPGDAYIPSSPLVFALLVIAAPIVGIYMLDKNGSPNFVELNDKNLPSIQGKLPLDQKLLGSEIIAFNSNRNVLMSLAQDISVSTKDMDLTSAQAKVEQAKQELKNQLGVEADLAFNALDKIVASHLVK